MESYIRNASFQYLKCFIRNDHQRIHHCVDSMKGLDFFWCKILYLMPVKILSISGNSASLLNTKRNRANFCSIYINMFFESNFMFKNNYMFKNNILGQKQIFQSDSFMLQGITEASFSSRNIKFIFLVT